MKTPETVKALFGLAIGPVDLLGALLDKDASERVKGALMVALIALGGWFANDYFGSTLTKGDLAELMALQQANTAMAKQNARELCRERGNDARSCEKMIQSRFEESLDAAESDLNFETPEDGGN